MSSKIDIAPAKGDGADVLTPAAIRFARFSALAAVLLLCFFALASLAIEVFNKLEELRNASTDNAEWNFSQIEVDYFRMRSEFEQVTYNKEPSLDKATQAFDIFYSRISVVENGPYYQTLSQDPQTNASFSTIHNFLEHWAGIVDGGPAVVKNNLDVFARQIDDIKPHVRRVSVLGLQTIVEFSDKQRRDIANTLLRLAVFTTVTIGVLLVSSIFLFRFNQISERSGAETQMINKRLSTVLNASLDAIMVMDIDGKILEYNTAAEVIFGYSPSDMIGHNMIDKIMPPKYRKGHLAGMERYKDRGRTRISGAGRVKLSALNKAGREFSIELAVDILKEGEETIFVAFIRDITLEVVSQEELVAARDRALAGERAKADFLAVMSHEMRTPLNGIIGTLALLEDTKLSKKQRESMDALRASATLMQHHVNDVLDISRFEAGKAVINDEVIEVDRLASEIIQEISDNARKNRNEIDYTFVNEMNEAVITDGNKLRQILNNLVGNANKFTRDGQVRIEIEAMDQNKDTAHLEFRVYDTGIGMHADDLERIFNDFETIDSAYTRAVEGVGLGLGIVRRLVQALGGTIGVESVQNAGSMFWFRIPVTKSRLVVKPEGHIEKGFNVDLKPMKILMVEDNHINRYVLREMLTAAGHTVDEAENGQRGLEAANSNRYDVILMDISMPEKDGVAASIEIRNGTGRSASTPIIATTAHALPHEVEKFHNAGITDILKKPIEKSQLFRKLAQVQSGINDLTITRDKTMAQVYVDEGRINEMKDQLGQAAMSSLMQRFVDEANAVVTKMNDPASKSADVLELVAEMHKVAGSAAALGVSGMQKQLNIMEHCGKTGDLDRLWVEAGDLAELWDKCKVLLKELDLA